LFTRNNPGLHSTMYLEVNRSLSAKMSPVISV
jgi:hypothetical protein